IQNSDIQPILKDNLMIHNGRLPAIYDSTAAQTPNDSRWGTYVLDGNKIINTKTGQGFINTTEANYILSNDSINRTNNKGAQSSNIGAPIYMTP
ncbi:MAG: hypothetical protein JNM93_10820, partial [Bacteriovoracaceae bacterium]|nr:hypothetical protein [Bacteriovoracaceae bacterium]